MVHVDTFISLHKLQALSFQDSILLFWLWILRKIFDHELDETFCIISQHNFPEVFFRETPQKNYFCNYFLRFWIHIVAITLFPRKRTGVYRPFECFIIKLAWWNFCMHLLAVFPIRFYCEIPLFFFTNFFLYS